jgi:pimeloyl-ACP methyl ester carboxylesterase
MTLGQHLKTSQVTEKNFAEFRPILADVLNRASLSSKRIWIAGHSLGGGLALIFLKKLLVSPQFKPLVAGTYTIGAPWIGDTAYAEDFDFVTNSMLARVVRMRYQNDLISILNPKNKFARESQLAVLTRDGGCLLEDRLMALFKVNPGMWFHRNKGMCSLNLSREEADRFANKNRTRLEDKEALADHSFFNYLKVLAKLRLNQK